MAKYNDKFELSHDIHTCIKASGDAIDNLGWKLLRHEENEFIVRNHEYSIGKKYPVKIEMTLTSLADRISRTTKIPYSTVKWNLRVLVNLGLLVGGSAESRGKHAGFTSIAVMLIAFFETCDEK